MLLLVFLLDHYHSLYLYYLMVLVDLYQIYFVYMYNLYKYQINKIIK